MNAKRVNAAADVIHRAMKQGKTLPVSLANALESTCMLQSPESVAEARQLRSELAKYERLSAQQCPKGLHPDWLVDSEYARACPWCRIAELEAAAVCPSVARLYGSKCVLPVRHGGDHRNDTRRHYWSDEYAAPTPARQQEDPHDGPLASRYLTPHDLPAIPAPRDRRGL